MELQHLTWVQFSHESQLMALLLVVTPLLHTTHGYLGVLGAGPGFFWISPQHSKIDRIIHAWKVRTLLFRFGAMGDNTEWYLSSLLDTPIGRWNTIISISSFVGGSVVNICVVR